MYENGIQPATGIWWKPAHKAEKVWIAIAFAWCMVLFAMRPDAVQRIGCDLALRL